MSKKGATPNTEARKFWTMLGLGGLLPPEPKSGKSGKPGQVYGSIPRTVNNSILKQNYDPSVRLPGMSSAGNAGSGGQSTDKDKDAYIPPTKPPTGRETPAPDGGSGMGTQMSPGAMTMDEANSLLTGGYKVANPFSSTQLPDTSGSPYFGKPDTPQYRSDVPADTYDVKLSRNLTDGSPFDDGEYTYELPTQTDIEYLQKAGSPLIPTGGAVQAADSKDTPVDPKNSGINWANRTAADNSDPNIARRRAFLDAPNSMQGLRRVEAQKGIVYAGGQHNMVNANAGQEGQNDFVKVSKADRDSYMRGDMGAENMREKYMAKVADSQQTEGDAFTSPPNYTMTPEVDVKTAQTQRPEIEVDTSVLGSDVTYEIPGLKFKGARDQYKK